MEKRQLIEQVNIELLERKRQRFPTKRSVRSSASIGLPCRSREWPAPLAKRGTSNTRRLLRLRSQASQA